MGQKNTKKIISQKALIVSALLCYSGMDVDQKCPVATVSVTIWSPIVTYHTETTNTADALYLTIILQTRRTLKKKLTRIIHVILR